jgi:sodium-dependent dicarboxylate transporter 2/3/5
MYTSILRTTALIRILPLVLIFLQATFGLFSGASGEPKTALVLLMMFWMVLWWIFDVMPLGITAMIPLIYLPFFNISDIDKITPHYSHSVIYLFLGGFILAQGLEKTRLSERIALEILRVVGKSDQGIVLGFTLATAFLSMWISNTATTVMMLPIAMSVVAFLRNNLAADQESNIGALALVLFLTIAYAASIGGIMTPVGTPPNVVFVGYLDKLYNLKIDFWRWMVVVMPIGLLVLLANMIILKKLFPYKVELPQGFAFFIREKLTKMGKMNGQQKITLGVFALVCFLWVFKDLIHLALPHPIINDTSTALLGGVLLFLLPTKQDETGWSTVLNVKDIPHLPWNILLLFGGGMAMAAAIKDVGLIESATQYFAALNITTPWLLVAVLATMTLFLTEIMSNVALCVVALPVIMNLGIAADINPIIIGMPAALCSSFAFMMPISTPPNAIVFGTGIIKTSDMMKAGFWLNIVSIVVVMTVGWGMMKLFL